MLSCIESKPRESIIISFSQISYKQNLPYHPKATANLFNPLHLSCRQKAFPARCQAPAKLLSTYSKWLFQRLTILPLRIGSEARLDFGFVNL